MPNDDSLFGDSGGYQNNFGSGMTNQGYDPQGGQDTWWNQPDSNSNTLANIHENNDYSTAAAMMAREGLFDYKYFNDFYTDASGNKVSKLELWDQKFGRYFEEYDHKKERNLKRNAYRDKNFNRKQQSKNMTNLNESFGSQGFVSSGDQIKSRSNLYDSAIRQQEQSDINLRSEVTGMKSNWQNGMWDTFANLAQQGGMSMSHDDLGTPDGWSYNSQSQGDSGNWEDYWDQSSWQGDDGFTVNIDSGGG